LKYLFSKIGKQNLEWNMGINLELKEGPHSHSSYYPDFANYSFNFLPKASPGFSGSLIKWRPSWPEYSSKQIANIKTPFDVFEDIDITMISGTLQMFTGHYRFSLHYLLKRAVRITEKPYTPQKERLCMLLGNPVIFTDCGETP
jgi:hypothetical protein